MKQKLPPRTVNTKHKISYHLSSPPSAKSKLTMAIVALGGITATAVTPANAATLTFTPNVDETGRLVRRIQEPATSRTIYIVPALMSTDENWQTSCTVTGKLVHRSGDAEQGKDFNYPDTVDFSLTTTPVPGAPERFELIEQQIPFEILGDFQNERTEEFTVEFEDVQAFCGDIDVTDDVDTRLPYIDYGGGLTIMDTYNADQDEDGVGTALDAFPNHFAASIDDDGDGYPDAWNINCDTDCREASGLTLDAFSNDRDNDGINDLEDDDDNNDGITDADSDSDGLIEIHSIEQLYNIRFQLNGLGRRSYGGDLDRSGCPAIKPDGSRSGGCWGYELVTDLDFDSNEDGVIDGSDEYIDSVYGWSPIGTENYFTGIFEGNGHSIDNLVSHHPTSAGLFGTTRNAEIRNIILAGPLAKIGKNSRNNSASFVANAIDSDIRNCYSTIDISNANAAGGIISAADFTSVSNCGYSGRLEGYFVGGILSHSSIAIINNVIFTGSINAEGAGGIAGRKAPILKNSLAAFHTGELQYGGGLVGNYYSTNFWSTLSSYWTTDLTNLTSSTGGGIGATLTSLQCAKSTDSSCADSPLFHQWEGNSSWDFGNNQQLPGLIINGRIFRDSDADGKLDERDAFPLDGAASLDADMDSLPDAWNSFCDEDCQQASDLSLDEYPNDTDNDGIINDEDDDMDGDTVPNTQDAFPLKPSASVDSDGDGFPDAWNTNCDETCQQNSGLFLDEYPDDPDRYGAPEILSAPADMNLNATGEATLVTLRPEDVVAQDRIDNDLTIEVSLDGTVLSLDQTNQITLPSGAHEITWVAIDDAGQRSEPAIQHVNIYPRIEFITNTSSINEGDSALVSVQLSGPSPAYPITVFFSRDNGSSADSSDIDSIDLNSLSLTFANEAEVATNTLEIPLLNDETTEGDETLSLTISSAFAGDEIYEMALGDEVLHLINIVDTSVPSTPEPEAPTPENPTTDTPGENSSSSGGGGGGSTGGLIIGLLCLLGLRQRYLKHQ